jgi:hypothetical protein
MLACLLACLLSGGFEEEEEVFVWPDFVLYISKSSSGTSSSPLLLLDPGDDDPDDLPAVQQEVSPTSTVVWFFRFHTFSECFVTYKYNFFLGRNKLFGTSLPILTFLLWDKLP